MIRQNVGLFKLVSQIQMRDFSLFSAQVRAARGLLGWSQAELATKTGINRTTLIDVEAGKREPMAATLKALVDRLTAAGIVFTETGVQFRKWPPNRTRPVKRLL